MWFRPTFMKLRFHRPECRQRCCEQLDLEMRVNIQAPSQEAKASEFGSGKVVQGLDPGPVSKKHGMTAEHRAAALRDDAA